MFRSGSVAKDWESKLYIIYDERNQPCKGSYRRRWLFQYLGLLPGTLPLSTGSNSTAKNRMQNGGKLRHLPLGQTVKSDIVDV
jgi:hypothetical protein